MLNYQPMPFQKLQRRLPATPAPKAGWTPRPVPALAAMGAPVAALVPPLPIDSVFAGYSGIPGVLVDVLAIGAFGASTYIGIREGLNKKNDWQIKTVGWVGGVGSALMGLIYIATKFGISEWVSLPAVRISPV